MRLIDADALLEAMNNFYTDEYFISAKAVKDVITNAPTVQREGWVSVPTEPTEEMIEAITSHLIDDNWHPDSVHEIDMPSLYKAMINASPPTSETNTEVVE